MSLLLLEMKVHSLIGIVPPPAITQLIQAQQQGVGEPQARAGASLPPPSLFFIWQVNNLNFKPTSAGEQGCTFSFFDSSLWIRTEFSQKLLEHSFYLFIFIQLSGHHCLGTTVPKQKLSFRQRRTREQLWPVVPTHHSFATSPA